MGLIAAGVNARMAALRRGRSTVPEDGHVVVLGWSEQVFTVAAVPVVANANQRRAAVALLADRAGTAVEDARHLKVGAAGGTDQAHLPQRIPHRPGRPGAREPAHRGRRPRPAP
ncbi:hypothetical protein [Streptomyces sp. I05A-00742]|uniref:hypothetical protein n=1 Tax=Streptomyces sp. I05A-00742 TaxID=2732853 RepID=UPI002017984B|nr:hypothetical protein [Streptomyces sp. I05A-00742]